MGVRPSSGVDAPSAASCPGMRVPFLDPTCMCTHVFVHCLERVAATGHFARHRCLAADRRGSQKAHLCMRLAHAHTHDARTRRGRAPTALEQEIGVPHDSGRVPSRGRRPEADVTSIGRDFFQGPVHRWSSKRPLASARHREARHGGSPTQRAPAPGVGIEVGDHWAAAPHTVPCCRQLVDTMADGFPPVRGCPASPLLGVLLAKKESVWRRS